MEDFEGSKMKILLHGFKYKNVRDRKVIREVMRVWEKIDFPSDLSERAVLVLEDFREQNKELDIYTTRKVLISEYLKHRGII